jgi:hypothetical protein
VEFIHDDHVEATEKPRPLVMARQDSEVREIWICKDYIGHIACPCPFRSVGISIRYGDSNAGSEWAYEVVKCSCLVGGKRLGGR